MARTPAQRGTFGRWLTSVREARYKTQAEALADMRRLAGLVIAPSEYAQWESGSRVPRADNPKRERLYEFFGSRPEDEPENALTGDLSELAASIRSLAQAIQEERAERLEWERGVLESVSSLARWLGQRDDPAPATRAGDQGTG